MTREKKNILFLTMIIILVIFLSSLLFLSGLTDKIRASIISSSKDELNAGNYPVIDMVINSSGQKYVNTDVTLTIRASSNYKISSLEYSYDLKKWKKVNKKFNSKKIDYKINFKKDMNKYVYLRVINNKGYKSYAYKTRVMIDKKKPKLKLLYENDEVLIKASDNNKISVIQYSDDCVNWQIQDLSAQSITLSKKLDKNTCVRVVDSVGNISDIKRVNK